LIFLSGYFTLNSMDKEVYKLQPNIDNVLPVFIFLKERNVDFTFMFNKTQKHCRFFSVRDADLMKTLLPESTIQGNGITGRYAELIIKL